MLNKKIYMASIIILSATLIFSCGGGGGGNAGQGGPDVSPDNIISATDSGSSTTSGTTTATNTSDTSSATSGTTTATVADSTTNTGLTGTTSSTEGTVVEPEVNTTIEGTIDTGKDTGTTTAAGITEEAGVDVSNTVNNVTDSETIAEDVNVILTGGTTEIAAGTTGSTGSVTEGTGTGSNTGSETSTGSSTTGNTASSTNVSDNTTTGTTTGTTDTTTGTTTGTTGTTTVTEGSTTGGTVIAESTVDTGAGETVEDLENDENVDQGNLQYSIDSSQGKWYNVTGEELFNNQTSSSIKAEIEKLREEIKTITQSYKNGKSKHDDAAAEIKQLRKKIADLRASIGDGGRMTDGIWTEWANQNLYLNIKSGASGWYRLVIVAKNNGTLPDDYDRFTFNINKGNDTIGGISVKASDNAYFRGSTIIKLDPAAGTQLNILWTNDAYLKNKYDANVNIKKIVLIKIKEPKEKLKTVKKFKGDQFSFMDGRWFFDKNDAYTFWSDQVIGYTFKNMKEGQYEVTIEAINHGTLPLPKDYKEFNVEVDSEYDSASVAIPADSKNYKKETFTMNFPEGDTTIYLTWTNDSYQENKYDTNIQYRFITAKKVKQSNLTAYLLKTKPGNRLFVLTAFIMISAIIAGIYMKNRRREA